MVAADVFYKAQLPACQQRCVLDGAEGKHAHTVRRFSCGDRLIITDGKGNAAYCEVVGLGSGSLELQCIRNEVKAPPTPKIIAVQAIAKGDKGDASFDVLTQAGVDVIIPWQAQRCIRKIDAKISQVQHKWEAKMFAAAKQSRRLWFPQLQEPVSTAQLLSILVSAQAADTQIIVLDEDGSTPLANVIVPTVSTIYVIVGPEGGIDPQERAQFQKIGARCVILGDTIYQSWLAGMAAVNAISVLTGRWDCTPIGQYAAQVSPE